MAADPSSQAPADPAPDAPDPGRGGRLLLWGVAIAVLGVSVFGGHHTSDDGASGAAGIPRTTATAPADPREPAGDSLPRSEPTRLRIPKIGVDAPFTELSLAATGQLEPPPAADTNLVGWYSKGAAPGERGTSIIAGHVDTTTSAAVFVNLDQLEAGDRFSVERADGREAEFVVDEKEYFPKDDFPSKRVYADTDRPEVRLITCAGDYDHAVRDYTENLVVFAHLA
ncbi:class F sortase [Streptomyces sp. LP11]|uniref:Class F sortase n=1 Tax=Streptomyces pyxinicus TaxID=2970331 RepID=A0ABT2B8G2_9ACTN|nr:class F sortase [Streptomyces sp. LP11]MCS0604814.1 class F sortase [Streptomyces sp. LP11]